MAMLDGKTTSHDDPDATERPVAPLKLLSLTDDQLSTVMNAAEPLLPGDGSQFLRDVAMALQGCELGDGLIGRCCAEVQRRYLQPPDFSRSKDVSKWR